MMKRIGELNAERVHDLNQIGGLQEENARLKAEVERLTEAWVDKKMQEDRDALLLQVERLTRAGDLLAFHYISLGRKFFPDDPLPSSIKDWNAAKEGKGQP